MSLLHQQVNLAQLNRVHIDRDFLSVSHSISFLPSLWMVHGCILHRTLDLSRGKHPTAICLDGKTPLSGPDLAAAI
jgi:hypothetical protein